MARTFVDSRGYRRFANSGKSVHRWVAEKKLGRPLRPKEVVHHRNRNKLDNKSKNLGVLSRQAVHTNIHEKAAKKYGARYSYCGY